MKLFICETGLFFYLRPEGNERIPPRRSGGPHSSALPRLSTRGKLVTRSVGWLFNTILSLLSLEKTDTNIWEKQPT